jgi:hypothetical protein
MVASFYETVFLVLRRVFRRWPARHMINSRLYRIPIMPNYAKDAMKNSRHYRMRGGLKAIDVEALVLLGKEGRLTAIAARHYVLKHIHEI